MRDGWTGWALVLDHAPTEDQARLLVEVLNRGPIPMQALYRERSDGFAVFLRYPKE